MDILRDPLWSGISVIIAAIGLFITISQASPQRDILKGIRTVSAVILLISFFLPFSSITCDIIPSKMGGIVLTEDIIRVFDAVCQSAVSNDQNITALHISLTSAAFIWPIIFVYFYKRTSSESSKNSLSFIELILTFLSLLIFYEFGYLCEKLFGFHLAVVSLIIYFIISNHLEVQNKAASVTKLISVLILWAVLSQEDIYTEYILRLVGGD